MCPTWNHEPSSTISQRVHPASLASGTTTVFIKILNTEGDSLNPAGLSGRGRIPSGINTGVIFLRTNLALWRDAGTQRSTSARPLLCLRERGAP